MMTSKKLIYILIPIVIAGCSTTKQQPIVIKETSLKVSQELPMGDCEEIGLLRGTTISVTGTEQNALDDLKQTALIKGANYLKVEEFSETGLSATGIAYKCIF